MPSETPTNSSPATSTSFYLEEITTSFSLLNIPTLEPPENAQEVALTVDDLTVAGVVLMVVIAITIAMNLYVIGIVGKNWSSLVRFPFAQSNLICMFLTLSDLLLACFLGLPAAIHLSFAEYFSEQPQHHMIYYSQYVGYFLLDYMFIFRSIIITVICIDRTFHILEPLAYKFHVSHRLTGGICTAMTLFPLIVRVIPQIIVLHHGEIRCETFQNPDPNETQAQTNVGMLNFTVPLTCNIDIWINLPGDHNMEEGMGFGADSETVRNSLPGRIALAEVILFLVILVVTFLSIIVCNVIILVVIVRRTTARKAMMHEEGGAMNKKLRLGIQKTLLATSIMAIIFLLSNGPFVVIWVADCYLFILGGENKSVLARKIATNAKLRLCLASCMFLSLLVNPWLYPLRMETIRKFFPCFNSSVSRDTSEKVRSTNIRISATKNDGNEKGNLNPKSSIAIKSNAS